MKQIIIILLLMACLSSCGPGAKEIAAAQHKREDSIRNATRLHIEKQQALQQSLENKRVEKSTIENKIMILVANLEAARDKLNSIKQYQFLRTANEREAQITSQLLLIQTIEKEWTESKASAALLQQQIDELAVNIKRMKDQ